MKTKNFRCSCCNEMKTDKRPVFKIWNSKVRQKDLILVAICRKCAKAINASRFVSVCTFLGGKE